VVPDFTPCATFREGGLAGDRFAGRGRRLQGRLRPDHRRDPAHQGLRTLIVTGTSLGDTICLPGEIYSCFGIRPFTDVPTVVAPE
jgi:hypothetical protein